MPIYSGGSKRAQQQQAEIEILKVQENIALAESGLNLEYEAARTQFSSATDIYYAEKASFELAQKLNQRTKDKYDLSVVNSIALTQSDLQILQVLGTYIQSIVHTVGCKSEPRQDHK